MSKCRAVRKTFLGLDGLFCCFDSIPALVRLSTAFLNFQPKLIFSKQETCNGAANNLFAMGVRLQVRGNCLPLATKVFIGSLLLLTKGVTPLLLNHSRRVGFPTTLCTLSRRRSLSLCREQWCQHINVPRIFLFRCIFLGQCTLKLTTLRCLRRAGSVPWGLTPPPPHPTPLPKPTPPPALKTPKNHVLEQFFFSVKDRPAPRVGQSDAPLPPALRAPCPWPPSSRNGGPAALAAGPAMNLPPLGGYNFASGHRRLRWPPAMTWLAPHAMLNQGEGDHDHPLPRPQRHRGHLRGKPSVATAPHYSALRDATGLQEKQGRGERGLGLRPVTVRRQVRGLVGPAEEGLRALGLVAGLAFAGSRQEGLVKGEEGTRQGAREEHRRDTVPTSLPLSAAVLHRWGAYMGGGGTRTLSGLLSPPSTSVHRPTDILRGRTRNCCCLGQFVVAIKNFQKLNIF